MNFENCEAFVIPFSIPETSVWKKVIQYLCEKETTPVDAICNSHVVSIVKEYYPVQRLEINYTAKWNAISIFKKFWTEQETHYEQQVHFFDRWGKEHEKPGFDYFDPKTQRWSYNPIKSNIKGTLGDAHSRPWTPREVTVAVTEDIPYERETGRKETSGEIKGNHLYYHDKEYPFYMILENQFQADVFSTIFSDSNSSSAENEKISYSKEAVKDGMVIEQSSPLNESDFDSELTQAKSLARTQCTGEIPGQAYADFRMEFDSYEVCQMWYYPVYHVIYEFKGQKYECFVSGYWKGSSFDVRTEYNGQLISSHQVGPVKGKRDPEDTSIESIKQQYDIQCSNLKDRKKKCWLKFVWIWLGMWAGFTILSLLLIPLAIAISNATYAIASVLRIVVIGVVIYLCWKNYNEIKNIKKEITKNEEAKKNIVPIRQAKKVAIREVILNDNLSDSEKSMKCEAILNNSTDYQ